MTTVAQILDLCVRVSESPFLGNLLIRMVARGGIEPLTERIFRPLRWQLSYLCQAESEARVSGPALSAFGHPPAKSLIPRLLCPRAAPRVQQTAPVRSL